jgi:hypothetical protein
MLIKTQRTEQSEHKSHSRGRVALGENQMDEQSGNWLKQVHRLESLRRRSYQNDFNGMDSFAREIRHTFLPNGVGVSWSNSVFQTRSQLDRCMDSVVG